MQEQLTAKETEAAEMQNRVDDLDYELQKRRQRADSLENHLAEALEKIKILQKHFKLIAINNYFWNNLVNLSGLFLQCYCTS